MCLLGEIYAAQRGRQPKDVVQLSPELRQELLAAAALIPLAQFDLRSPAAPVLVCSDACETGKASVFAQVAPVLAKEFPRHALQKGLWTKLLRPLPEFLRASGRLDPEEELPDGTFSSHPIWEEAATTLEFSTLVAKQKVGRRRHINVLELEAAVEAERAVGEAHPGSRVMQLLDSQVALGALLKGRAASEGLNKVLRRSIASHVSLRVTPSYGYINTKINPSDGPSRGQPVPAPIHEPSGWFLSAMCGDFGGLDQELLALHMHPSQLAQLPPARELLPDSAVDSRSGAEVRRERSRRFGAGRATSEARSPAKEPLVQNITPQLQTAPPPLAPAASVKQQPSVKASSEAKPSAVATALASFSSDQFLFSSRYSSLKAALSSGPGCLDLFSGSRNLPRALIRNGAPWVLCFDLLHSASEDLLAPSLRRRIEFLLSHGAFASLTAGPVCSSFSTAITPPCRSWEHLEGVPWCSELQQQKCRDGNSFCRWCARLVRLCSRFEILFAIENPWSSWFWKQVCWSSIPATSYYDFGVDFCRFGTAWRKRTRFRCNFFPEGFRLFCVCQKPHVQLRGHCKKRGKLFTKLAEPYPRKLCELVSQALVSAAGWLPERRKLDVVECARCLCSRIGEAANPGPRRATPRPHRAGVLDDIQLLQPATVALRARYWQLFESWFDEHVGSGALREVLRAPVLLIEALRSASSCTRMALLCIISASYLPMSNVSLSPSNPTWARHGNW